LQNSLGAGPLSLALISVMTNPYGGASLAAETASDVTVA
jgi:hypothetical protein